MPKARSMLSQISSASSIFSDAVLAGELRQLSIWSRIALLTAALA